VLGGNATLWGDWARTLLQVHDELVQEFHPALANWARTQSVERMENAGGITLRVPIKVDAALGTSWSGTKE
jgi:DNA polymerase I-like protein with 3'-5' exonuclease and polymerase domains